MGTVGSILEGMWQFTKKISVLIVLQKRESNHNSDAGTKNDISIDVLQDNSICAAAETNIAPMLRIPPKAALVLRFICKFQTKKTGNIPKVKSQKMVSAL